MSDLCSKPGCTRQIPDFSQRCHEHEISPGMHWFFVWTAITAIFAVSGTLVLFWALIKLVLWVTSQ